MNNVYKKLQRLWKLNGKIYILLKLLKLEDLYYRLWVKKNENYNIKKIQKDIKHFKYKPKISILIPVYKVPIKYLNECLNSIFTQYYKNWEICIVDDNSNSMDIIRILKKYEKKYKDKIKLKFRKVNGHISQTTNDALSLATGEYILLLDNDDIISPECLYEIVKVLNKDKSIDLIYSNEDKIDKERRFYPYFKPKWNREILKIDNYISHVGVYRRQIAKGIKGFTVGLEGAQDWDFVLRFTQQTNRVVHIPKFLYHWRYIDSSTSKSLDNKPYAKIAREEVQKRIKGGYYD